MGSKVTVSVESDLCHARGSRLLIGYDRTLNDRILALITGAFSLKKPPETLRINWHFKSADQSCP